jgi:hypothetical protein
MSVEPLDNGFGAHFEGLSPMAQRQLGNNDHVSTSPSCNGDLNHACSPLDGGVALDHAASLLDMRSPSQRPCASRSHGAEVAVRQFISAVSKTYLGPYPWCRPHDAGQSRSYRTQLIVSRVVVLVWAAQGQ